jgi:hypothetical protein
MIKSLQISDSLFQDLRSLIIEARQDVFSGEKIVNALSTQLVSEFGMGFAEKNLRRMVQFAEVFPDEQIVVTLSRQLGWSHFGSRRLNGNRYYLIANQLGIELGNIRAICLRSQIMTLLETGS